MPIKYFCDVCSVEVPDPSVSLDMTGKILCGKHLREHEKENKRFNRWVYVRRHAKKPLKKWYTSTCCKGQ